MAENLEKGKHYKFRVKAVNSEGESEPLETEQSTLAKNPFGKIASYSRLPSVHRQAGCIFSDKPAKPGKPEPTDWDKDHVDLQWQAPATDGGAPIEKYVIEKRSKYGR